MIKGQRSFVSKQHTHLCYIVLQPLFVLLVLTNLNYRQQLQKKIPNIKGKILKTNDLILCGRWHFYSMADIGTGFHAWSGISEHPRRPELEHTHWHTNMETIQFNSMWFLNMYECDGGDQQGLGIKAELTGHSSRHTVTFSVELFSYYYYCNINSLMLGLVYTNLAWFWPDRHDQRSAMCPGHFVTMTRKVWCVRWCTRTRH